MLSLNSLNFSYQLHKQICQNFFFSKNTSALHGYPRNPKYTSVIFLVNRNKSRDLFRSLFIIGFLYMTLIQLFLNMKTRLIRWKNWHKKPHYNVYIEMIGKPSAFGRLMFLINFFLFPFFLRDGFAPSFFGHGSMQFMITHPVIYHPFLTSILQNYLKNRLWFRYGLNFKYRISQTIIGTYLDHLRSYNLPLIKIKVQYVVDWERYLLYNVNENYV